MIHRYDCVSMKHSGDLFFHLTALLDVPHHFSYIPYIHTIPDIPDLKAICSRWYANLIQMLNY